MAYCLVPPSRGLLKDEFISAVLQQRESDQVSDSGDGSPRGWVSDIQDVASVDMLDINCAVDAVEVKCRALMSATEAAVALTRVSTMIFDQAPAG